MSLTPEQQQVASVIAGMNFIKPGNVSQSFQRPEPVIAEHEDEISEEQHLVNQKSIAEILRARGFRHPNDHL